MRVAQPPVIVDPARLEQHLLRAEEFTESRFRETAATIAYSTTTSAHRQG
mgnify:CR=1 FL=1